MELDWRKLYFGRVSPAEVQEAVRDESWRCLRTYMKGLSTARKYKVLTTYLERATALAKDEHEIRMVHVRVTNYITALSRGGIIKPEDYR